jgi:hypothetical protein
MAQGGLDATGCCATPCHSSIMKESNLCSIHSCPGGVPASVRKKSAEELESHPRGRNRL